MVDIDPARRRREHGILDEDDTVELIDGLLLVKERPFGEGWFVQTQSPITPGERSLP